MSHHHSSGDDHHGHDRDHSDHEAAGSGQGPTEIEKLARMVHHWIHHNEDHARSYREWAEKAREAGREEVYMILEEVARGTALQNENLARAEALLKKA